MPFLWLFLHFAHLGTHFLTDLFWPCSDVVLHVFLALSDVYVLFVLLEQWFWILQDSFGNLRKAMALPNPYPKCTRVQRLSYNCTDLWTPDVLDDSWLLC